MNKPLLPSSTKFFIILRRVLKFVTLSGVLVLALLVTQPACSYETRLVTAFELNNNAPLSVGQKPHHAKRLSLTLEGRELSLLVNDTRLFTEGGSIQLDLPDDFLVLSGVVDHMPGSWVRITIIGHELFGLIDLGDRRFQVSTSVGEDIDSTVSPESSLEGLDQQARRLQKSYQLQPVTGLVTGKSFTRVLNVGIVVDELFDARYNGRGVLHAIGIINGVDGIFRQELSLAVQLNVAILAADQDFSKIGGASPAQLDQFRLFRLKTPELRNLTLIHLFTGAKPPNNDGVGFAYIGAICQGTGYDISVSAQYYRDTALAAHEIGHNLGALHDTDTAACRNNPDHLMNPVVSGALSFSSCSLERINATLKGSSCVSEVHDGSIKLRQSGSSGFIVQVKSDSDFTTAIRSEVLVRYEGKIINAPSYCYREGSDTLICTMPLITPRQSFEFFVNLDLGSTNLGKADIAAEFVEEGVYDNNRLNNIAELVINGNGSGIPLASNTSSQFNQESPVFKNLQTASPVALVKSNWTAADIVNRQIECRSWYWNNNQSAYVANNSSFYRYKHTADAGTPSSGTTTVAHYVSGSNQVITGTALQQQPWDIYNGRYSGPASFGRSAYLEVVGVSGGQRNAIRSWTSNTTFDLCTSFPDTKSGLVPNGGRQTADCVDTAPVGDGWGWNGQNACKVPSPLVLATGSNAIIFGLANTRVDIDGRIDSNEWSGATTKDTFGTTLSLPVAIAGIRGERGVDEWRVMHDQYYLYIALTVPDSTPFKDSVLYRNDDSVEIFVDAGNQGGLRYDQDDARFILRESGEVDGIFNSNVEIFHSRRYIPSNQHYVYEIKIAKSYEQIVGQSFGFNIQVNNDQNGGIQDAKWGWVGEPGNNTQWFRPASFGQACLDIGIASFACTALPPEARCLDTGAIGDGWGWNGTATWRVVGTGSVTGNLTCVDTGVIGDGWGWDGTKSCPISGNVTNTPTCVDTGVIGDGWGWDGTKSCPISGNATNTPTCVDTGVIGDGWGWDGTKSCPISGNATNTPTCVDTGVIGDGWGWDGTKSCRLTIR